VLRLRRQPVAVEPGDRADAALALAQVVEEGVRVVAERCERAQAGHDNLGRRDRSEGVAAGPAGVPASQAGAEAESLLRERRAGPLIVARLGQRKPIRCAAMPDARSEASWRAVCSQEVRAPSSCQ